MSTPLAMADSEVLSSLASNQSGLASLSDDAEGQCQSPSSQISAESGATLNLCDYMGLSEVSSAPVQMADSREDQNAAPKTIFNLILQETELTLGPLKALPTSPRAQNGAPFQPNGVFSLPTTSERRNETVDLPKQAYAMLNIYHTANAKGEMKDYQIPKKGASGFEQAESIKLCEGVDERRHDICQKGFPSSADQHGMYVTRHAEGLDLGVGLFPHCLAHYPYEEVGENKVSSCSRGMEEQTFVEPQKQCMEHNKIPENIENLEKFRDIVVAEEPIEDKEQRKCNAINKSLYQLTFKRPMPNKLQEVITRNKHWQPEPTAVLTDAGINLTKHELSSLEYNSATQDFKLGQSSSANGIAGARKIVDALKSPLKGTKRAYSEALEIGSAVINAASKAPNFGNGHADCESKVYGKHLVPPLFPWSPNNHSNASWAPKIEPPGWRLDLFPLTGQPISYVSPDYHFTTLPEKLVGGKLSNSEFGDGLNDAGTTDEDDAIVIAPRNPVGWPPVQSFRKNSLPPPHLKTIVKTEAIIPTSAGTRLHVQSKCSYVKVYMDGLPIGRKVDLQSHDSYDKLSLTLEDMFKNLIGGGNSGDQNSTLKEMMAASTGKKMNFFCGSDYVLTYEDEDGDLMLVGDVPWRMFTMTVKRLRIMKSSEAIGLAPKDLEENKS
ncbi:hypothetical protein O6H91_04G012200 [Diphasiastrum complanatum]|uniref:Uncharacterized protein n=4 Tax=Diphasiastrum complanatum TaxID=34168 RepID=A0ACC2DUP2_DIPCM|nr:hypothetical protein O6H91_04G012200 [Diphasiastrum complanatum]KAJ7557840.1 hypothetical protein O6H91_04G012200 [Diphasiastrum complanatum]KAJ7557841.1 hypothetical protein O6H91_04G012200 [Diphasiastrum complanatum]KAJ7557842.1 hypothetical protein O6H91_04G012200 [Diphasiastrum complanatum]